MAKTIADVRPGDVVWFKKHAIRVESIVEGKSGRRQLVGRVNTDGCPVVRRWYFGSLPVQGIDRE